MQRSDHPGAFYVAQTDGAFLATEATRGPWSPQHQHGGPPSALIMRAVEHYGDDAADFVVARLTVELLQPIAIESALSVEIEPVKLGGQAQRLAVRLRLGDGKLVAHATALRLRTAEVTLPESPRHPPSSPLPSPERSEPMVFPFFDETVGYHTAVEVRIARGEWGRGRCAAWLRPTIPLIDGEVLSSLQCVAIAADAVNGIAMVLDSRQYAFVNPDMTIILVRAPRGSWVGMDARAVATPRGVGMNDCRLHDEDGELGRVLQSLVVRAQR